MAVKAQADRYITCRLVFVKWLGTDNGQVRGDYGHSL